MSVFLEILAHRRVVLTILRTEGIALNAMDDRLVVGQSLVASIAFRCLRPGYQLIEVLALHLLSFSTTIQQLKRWHGGIIGLAHQILSQGIEAVFDMRSGDRALLSGPKLMVRVAHEFLVDKSKMSASILTMNAANLTHQTVELMEHLDEVDPPVRIPRESPRIRQPLALSPFPSRSNNHGVHAQALPHLIRMGRVLASILGVVGVRLVSIPCETGWSLETMLDETPYSDLCDKYVL